MLQPARRSYRELPLGIAAQFCECVQDTLANALRRESILRKLGAILRLLFPLLLFVFKLHPVMRLMLVYSSIYSFFLAVTTQANRYLSSSSSDAQS